jgi:hypothetical protein
MFLGVEQDACSLPLAAVTEQFVSYLSYLPVLVVAVEES